MDKFKSAQGLSLSTMIIGIIVIVVLLVLVGLFGGFFSNRFNPGFSEATEKECNQVNGYKQLNECGIDPQNLEEGYNYEQVYAKFKEGALEENKVCCKSSCLALGGKCKNSGACSPENRLPSGNSGCATGTLICCSQ